MDFTRTGKVKACAMPKVGEKDKMTKKNNDKKKGGGRGGVARERGTAPVGGWLVSCSNIVCYVQATVKVEQHVTFLFLACF